MRNLILNGRRVSARFGAVRPSEKIVIIKMDTYPEIQIDQVVFQIKHYGQDTGKTWEELGKILKKGRYTVRSFLAATRYEYAAQ